MQLMDRVEQDFHSSGKPLHVADPSHSMFRILTVQEFDEMEDDELQNLHTHYHLLVTGYPQASFGFDPEGLATLASPSRVFTIHGVSFVQSKHNPCSIISSRLFSGCHGES
jgi:hypothetical protein